MFIREIYIFLFCTVIIGQVFASEYSVFLFKAEKFKEAPNCYLLQITRINNYQDSFSHPANDSTRKYFEEILSREQQSLGFVMDTKGQEWFLTKYYFLVPDHIDIDYEQNSTLSKISLKGKILQEKENVLKTRLTCSFEIERILNKDKQIGFRKTDIFSILGKYMLQKDHLIAISVVGEQK
jgi:hypothetical protein